jgi:hypothetical protein
LKLRLSSDFAVDTDDYKREGLRFSILAMSGHGKSNATADLVEDVLEQHGQVIIIEPIPEWHTLKARFNTVVVIGGPYQDLPLEPAFAHEYVKAALEKGISLVVNISDIEDDVEQLHFVSSFLWNLYRLEQKYRRVLFLVLEEADIYAPQSWDQTSKQSLSRVSLIAKHGRKIGIFPILISQRPADLHKSPLSQCNINLFGKFTSPADLDPKTGLMFLVKKQHLQITEDQIMKLPTGSFIVAHKGGVDTIAVRKRLCPHGADTPLIEAKPFTADLSQALGNLREEITKAVEAKKGEESIIKRQEKEITQLKSQMKELEAKANIKISMKEMLEGNGVTPQVMGSNPTAMAELEEFRSGKKLAESVQQRLEFLGKVKVDFENKFKVQEEELKLYDEFQSVLRRIFPKGIQPNPFLEGSNPSAVGLQPVKKIVSLEEARLIVPTIRTDTAKGKILGLAKDGFFSVWKGLGDIQGHFISNAINYTDDAITKALKELVDSGILGMKHTDRNRWKLSPDVTFEDKKEAS